MVSSSKWTQIYKFNDRSRGLKHREFAPDAGSEMVHLGDGIVCVFGSKSASGTDVYIRNFQEQAEQQESPIFKLTKREYKQSVNPPDCGIDSPTGICVGKLN